MEGRDHQTQNPHESYVYTKKHWEGAMHHEESSAPALVALAYVEKLFVVVLCFKLCSNAKKYLSWMG